MELEEAIKEMKSLSPSAEAIDTVLKELDKKDKVINLIIDDFQAENYFINMTNKEVREYYSKRKELK